MSKLLKTSNLSASLKGKSVREVARSEQGEEKWWFCILFATTLQSSEVNWRPMYIYLPQPDISTYFLDSWWFVWIFKLFAKTFWCRKKCGSSVCSLHVCRILSHFEPRLTRLSIFNFHLKVGFTAQKVAQRQAHAVEISLRYNLTFLRANRPLLYFVNVHAAMWDTYCSLLNIFNVWSTHYKPHSPGGMESNNGGYCTFWR